jgi:hypothetical protein
LTLALLNITERTVAFVKYLLENGADPNIGDLEEQASLHYLAKIKISNNPYYPFRNGQYRPMTTEQLEQEEKDKIKI